MIPPWPVSEVYSSVHSSVHDKIAGKECAKRNVPKIPFEYHATGGIETIVPENIVCCRVGAINLPFASAFACRSVWREVDVGSG